MPQSCILSLSGYQRSKKKVECTLPWATTWATTRNWSLCCGVRTPITRSPSGAVVRQDFSRLASRQTVTSKDVFLCNPNNLSKATSLSDHLGRYGKDQERLHIPGPSNRHNCEASAKDVITARRVGADVRLCPLLSRDIRTEILIVSIK